jgi:hypothetical protein
MRSLIYISSIERKFLGGEEALTFEEFYELVVQDYETGLNIVKDMLAGEDPYPYDWIDNDPAAYEEFRIIHRSALKTQIALFEAEFND